ncbi:recombinase family protein [Nocardia gipuzkoensis]
MTTNRRRGRPALVDPAVLHRLLTLHAQGLSRRAVAAALNAEGLATPMNRSPWRATHVQRILSTVTAQEMARTL